MHTCGRAEAPDLNWATRRNNEKVKRVVQIENDLETLQVALQVQQEQQDVPPYQQPHQEPLVRKAARQKPLPLAVLDKHWPSSLLNLYDRHQLCLLVDSEIQLLAYQTES